MLQNHTAPFGPYICSVKLVEYLHLPESFLNSLQQVTGFSRESFVQEHLTAAKVTSVRFNPFKCQQADLLFAKQNLPLTSQVPWCATGYYLQSRPLFTLDPLFHAGCYYVQEASSMFLEEVVQTVCPEHATGKFSVLDLCAAPGGKATHLSSLFPAGLVIANEVIKSRVPVLADNTTKWGKENIVVTCNDAADFKALEGYFDIMVADAPCSGSGMFRKDSDAISEWSLQNVVHCSKRQQRILYDSWAALKEDGILIYSTCSYSKEENEDILDWIAETFNVETIPVPRAVEWGIVESVSERKRMFGYRFFPDKISGEGFFIACLRKKDTVNGRLPKPAVFAGASKQEQSAIVPYLVGQEQYELLQFKDEIRLLNKKSKADCLMVASALYIKKAGITVGRVVKNELIPAHDLALSTVITTETKAINTDLPTALNYLRKKEIPSDNAATGWNVVRYKDQNLGWVKVLANRVNNYYPSTSRILNH